MDVKKAKDLKISTRLLVLLYGDTGAGKTTMATTFPKPILFFDCDRGEQTYAGMDGVDYIPYQEDPTTRRPTVWKKFSQDIHEAATSEEKYATYVVDSSTTLLDFAIADILGVQGGSSITEGLSLAQWGTLTNRFSELFRTLRSYPGHVVVTGHTQVFQDDLTREVIYLTNMVGKKFAKKLPLFFGEVYRCFLERNEDGDPVYMVQTQKDERYPARSQFNEIRDEDGKLTPILNRKEPADFQHILSKVENYKKKTEGR